MDFTKNFKNTFSTECFRPTASEEEKQLNNGDELRVFQWVKLWQSGWEGSQSAFTCSKSAIETLEQGMKYVQS